MRRFTLDELLIGGEPHIVDTLLCAVRNCVHAKVNGPHRSVKKQAHKMLATECLLAAHEMLKKHGVNVMLEPAQRGPHHDLRKQNAAKVQKQVLDMIRDLDAKEGR